MENISKFIHSHRQLDELPFLIVFRTMVILRELGVLSVGDKNAVD